MTPSKPSKPGPTEVGIYNEAVSRINGKELRQQNFIETKTMARTLSPSFGPNGSSKMVIQLTKEVNVTQKGHVITKSFKKRFPIVQILINLVDTQEKNYGDGTKTALLFTGLLLEKAWTLLGQDLAPPIIAKGYALAAEKALTILEENSISFDPETQQDILSQLFASVMTNRLTYDVKQFFIKILLQMLKDYSSLFFTSKDFDVSDIYFRKARGRNMEESELVDGIIIYKNKPDAAVPTRIEKPGILLVAKNLDFFIQDNISVKREAEIKDPKQFKDFSGFDYKYYTNLAHSFRKKGVNVLLCEKRINTELISICSTLGIIALELVGPYEMGKLSKMLNVGIVSTINDFSEKDVGKADLAAFEKVSSDEMLFIRKTGSPILTLLLRGGTPKVLDELEEGLRSALRVAIQTIKDRKVLPGAGALECEIAMQLKKYALTFPNTLQLAIDEFATALENIPSFLIANSGKDPLELLPQLRQSHAKGKKYEGFECNSSKIVDVVKAGIYDGYSVKKHVLQSAAELACQVIRVDDVIMVRDRRLYEKHLEEGKGRKMEKREESMRKYLKKHERDFVPS